jgi:hypothetical protein
MKSLENVKIGGGLLGTGVTNGNTVTANIDTLGFEEALVIVTLGTSNTASNNPSVLKLSESDDTVVTNFADITEFVGDGSGGFTVASADTANANIYNFALDLRARKRYLRLTISPTTTQEAVYNFVLAKPAGIIDTATEAGALNRVVG